MELVIIRDAREVGRLRLSEGTFSIGRGLHNTIAFDEQSVSRRHARIMVDRAKVLIQDLGSVNGTFLRGQRITEESLEDGDVVAIGPFLIKALLTEEEEAVVSHEGESTLTAITLRDLEASALRASAEAALPRGRPAPVVRADPVHPDDASDWMEPKELFGLSDDKHEEKSEAYPINALADTIETEIPVSVSSELPTSPEDDSETVLEVEALEEADKSETPRLPNTIDLASARSGRSGEPPSSGADELEEGRARLRVVRGRARKTHYDLSQGTLFIGRAEEMEIVLLDANASRRHAAVSFQDGHYVVRDLFSLNGIRLNGRRVSDAPLRSGDKLSIGDVTFEFTWAADPPRELLELAPPLPAPPTPPPSAHAPARSVADTTMPGPQRPRKGFPVALVVSALSASILAIPLGLWLFRTEPAPQTTPLPPQLLSTEQRLTLERARVLMEENQLERALSTVLAVQAQAPRNDDARRLAAQIEESRVLESVHGHMLDRLIDQATAEAAPTPGPASAETPAPSAPVAAPPVAVALAPVSRPPAPSTSSSSPPSRSQASTAATSPTHRSSTAPAAERSNSSTKTEEAPPQEPSSVKSKPAGSEAGVEKRVALLFDKGLAARAQGRYLDAIRAFEQARAEDTFRETELYYRIGDEIEATQALLHDAARPLVTEAIALQEQGKLEEARKKLADAVARDPYYATAVTRLRQVEKQLADQAKQILVEAQTLHSSGSLEEAEQLYRKVLRLVPDPSNVTHQQAALRLAQLKKGP